MNTGWLGFFVCFFCVFHFNTDWHWHLTPGQLSDCKCFHGNAPDFDSSMCKVSKGGYTRILTTSRLFFLFIGNIRRQNTLSRLLFFFFCFFLVTDKQEADILLTVTVRRGGGTDDVLHLFVGTFRSYERSARLFLGLSSVFLRQWWRTDAGGLWSGGGLLCVLRPGQF